jgi:hypothetical protein
MNFAQVVDQIRSSSSTKRQKGALFKEFIRRCGFTDSQAVARRISGYGRISRIRAHIQ